MSLIAVLFAGSCDNADREFKTFALVNAHDPDNIGIFIQSIGFAIVDFSVVDLVNVSDEVEEPAKTHGIEGSRLSQKQLKIRAPLLPSGQRPAPLFIARLRNELRQKVPDLKIDQLVPPAIYKLYKSSAFFDEK